ncbi:hypothetical protein [Caldithrix abyssi]
MLLSEAENRLLSVVEATVDCEEPSIDCAPLRLRSGQAFDCAPFGFAQGAGVWLFREVENRLLSVAENRLLSVAEATVDC